MRATKRRESSPGKGILAALRARIQLGQPFVLAFDGERAAWLGPVQVDPAFNEWATALRQAIERKARP